MPQAALNAGIYGKSPAHGDFLSHGVSGAVRDALHDWISEGLRGLSDSRPLDCEAVVAFLAGPRALGPAWSFGALATSRDQVGRPFLWAAVCEEADEPAAAWAITAATALAGAARVARNLRLDEALIGLAAADAEARTRASEADPDDCKALADLARDGRMAAWTDTACVIGDVDARFFGDLFARAAPSLTGTAPLASRS